MAKATLHFDDGDDNDVHVYVESDPPIPEKDFTEEEFDQLSQAQQICIQMMQLYFEHTHKHEDAQDEGECQGNCPCKNN